MVRRRAERSRTCGLACADVGQCTGQYMLLFASSALYRSRSAPERNKKTAESGVLFSGQLENSGRAACQCARRLSNARTFAPRFFRQAVGIPAERHSRLNGEIAETDCISKSRSPSRCSHRKRALSSASHLPFRNSNFNTIAASFTPAPIQLPSADCDGKESRRGDHRMAPSGTGNVLRSELKA